MSAYGSIYCAGNATAQTLVAATAEKVDALTTKGASSDDLTGALDCVPDATAQKITVRSGGIYRVSYHVTVDNGVADVNVLQFGVRYDGVNEVPGTHQEISVASSAVGQHISGGGILEAGASDRDVELWATASDSGDITVTEGVLIVERIG